MLNLMENEASKIIVLMDAAKSSFSDVMVQTKGQCRCEITVCHLCLADHSMHVYRGCFKMEGVEATPFDLCRVSDLLTKRKLTLTP